ncbi:MAG: helix-turn-helix domain-containing protein [Pseudonocardia sp.]
MPPRGRRSAVRLRVRGTRGGPLASAAGMTQSAVVRLEAGGTVPTLPVLGRIARALDADLTVRVAARPHGA